MANSIHYFFVDCGAVGEVLNAGEGFVVIITFVGLGEVILASDFSADIFWGNGE